MKKNALLFLILILAQSAFAQSKKDLDQKILLLEEKQKNLENEIFSIKTNLANTTTTMGLLSRSNTDLEKQVNNQNLLIVKLTRQNDSLLKVFNIKNEDEFVSSPQNEEDSIINLIQSYFSCKKWEDRLALVVHPETVKPYMKEQYQNNYVSRPKKKNDIHIQGSGYKTNEVFRVLVSDYTFYCKKEKEGIKIDWEASYGYNPKSFKAFASEESKSPTIMRLDLGLSTYYNDIHKLTSDTYFSFSGENDNQHHQIFMLKTTNGASDLKKLLADGNQHQVIVEVVYKTVCHKDYPDCSFLPDNFIFITKYLKEGWSNE